MALITILSLYFVSVTVCVTVNGEATELMPTNETKTASPLVRVINGNVLRNGNIPTNKNIIEQKAAYSLDSNGYLKKLESKPNPISTHMPLILNRSRVLPLVIQTQNFKPASLHYARLNKDPDRQNNLKPEANKEIPRKKVTAVDKPKKQKKTSRKHKPKNLDIIDDINFRSLPQEHKHSKVRKNKKTKSDKDLSNLRKGIYNDTKYEVFEIDPDIDIEDDLFKNQTHAILVTEVLPSGEYENAYEDENQLNIDDKSARPIVKATEETEVPMTPNVEDEVTVMILKNDDTNSNDEPIATITKAIPRPHPVINLSSNNGIPNIIIKESEFEEIEEAAEEPCTEQPLNEDFSPLTPIQSWDNYGNPYYNFLPNYQSPYDRYLKYLNKGNQNVYECNNFYPGGNLAVPYSSSKNGFIQTVPETVVQDIYGPKPDLPNVIDIRPENAIGRVWRSWKGTEVQYKKPQYLNNKPLGFGRNLNDLNYGGIAKPPALYGPQSVGINGYYNNFNNAVPYRCPYPYRYNIM